MPVEVAAELAGVEPPTIRQWVHRGHVRAYRRRTPTASGRLVWRSFYDPRELLLAERATRHRGAAR